ncbi:MAG: hypothetical protein ABSE51_04035 [Terracidiphilus sp.]
MTILMGLSLFGAAQTSKNTAIAKDNRVSNSPNSGTDLKPIRSENLPINTPAVGNNRDNLSGNNGAAAQLNEDKNIAKYTKYLFWAGILQAVVLSGTLIAIFWQACLMRVHAGHLHELAGAAKENANAALSQVELMKRQMDTMVHKDRARLNLYAQPIKVNGTEGGFLYLTTCIELTNSGQSNAYITFSAGRFVVVRGGRWPLPQPDPDDFTTGSSIIEPSEDPVCAGFVYEDAPLKFRGFAEEFAKGDLTAYLYGFVEYENMGIKHHRDFGYVWATDPSDRNSASQSLEEMITNGSWQPSLKLDNGEREMKTN